MRGRDRGRCRIWRCRIQGDRIWACRTESGLAGAPGKCRDAEFGGAGCGDAGFGGVAWGGAGFGVDGVHRSVEVQDLGVNLVACDDLEGCSGALSVPWTGSHGHCQDGVHREAPRGTDLASGGVLGARQLQYPAVPVALVAPLPHPAPHGWSQSRDFLKYPSCAQPGVSAHSTFTRTPVPGSQPHGETPQRDSQRFVPSLPAPLPSRGFLGDRAFRRASQAPCAAAPCAGMFSQFRRAAESRIITGNVPGVERGAAWSRGHLHGPGTALRAAGSLHPRTGVPPGSHRVPPFPCQPGPTHPSGSCRGSPGRRCHGTVQPPHDSGQGH